MFPNQAFAEEKVVLGPGDILCLYTDGIAETRRDETEEYGDGRLADRLRELAGLPAQTIRDRIFEDVFAFSGCSEAGDDMTVVVVKRNP